MNVNRDLLVEPEWLKEHLEDSDILVVDTRGNPDFEAAHIPGAINFPSGELFDPNTVGSDLLPPEEIEQRLSAAGIDNDTRLIFYDDSGLVPSARVFWVLENLGRGNMALLNGGFLRWATQSMPTESGGAKPAPATFRATSVGSAFATKEEVLAALEDENTVLVDTRTEEEYYGRTAQHTRNGHIPGAKHIDWQQHIADLFDPTLIPIPELAALYQNAGVTPDKSVIAYCRTASRSSHTYFVLRLLGYRNVKNYSGSWMEWNADESLPIE